MPEDSPKKIYCVGYGSKAGGRVGLGFKPSPDLLDWVMFWRVGWEKVKMDFEIACQKSPQFRAVVVAGVVENNVKLFARKALPQLVQEGDEGFSAAAFGALPVETPCLEVVRTKHGGALPSGRGWYREKMRPSYANL